MAQYVTVENALILMGAVGWLVAGIVAWLRWMAPRTVTPIDDKILDAINQAEKAKVWATTYAPYLWQALEWAAASNKLPTGTTKAAEFLLRLRDAYRAQHNAELPSGAEATAQVVAGAMSAGAKIVPPASDPRLAPPAVSN